MAKKKTPVDAFNLAAETFTGVDEIENLGDRIARYGTAHSRTVDMRDHLREVEGPNALKAVAGLASCGNYLHFREYFTVGKVRLHNATFCKQHLICPLCAIRRGAKALGAYLARWEVIRAERPDLKPYLLTLTVKNGDDLEERHTHLTKSLRKLLDHRRNFNSGVRGSPWTELCKAEGGVYTHEQTNKGKGWHPHTHMIVLAASAPSQSALSAEWHRITGDSMIVDCRPITGGESGDYSEGFMEVFKYAVKFSDLSLEDNWHASQVLKGKRLLNSFGLFRGVEVPESLLDEPLDSLPFWDRFYRFIGGEYRFTGESPKTPGQDDQDEGQPRSYEVCKPSDPAAVVDLPGGNRPEVTPPTTEVLRRPHLGSREARQRGAKAMTYILSLAGLSLHHYGRGVYGWGPISSTTGQPGRLVEWTMRSEVEAWVQARAVFCSGAKIEKRTV